MTSSNKPFLTRFIAPPPAGRRKRIIGPQTAEAHLGNGPILPPG
jgi:hypothetical protein